MKQFLRHHISTVSRKQYQLNETEITSALQLSKQQILNRVNQWISEGSAWMINLVDNLYTNKVKYHPLQRSYIKLPEEHRNAGKGIINMENKDNECYRWCHIRHYESTGEKPTKDKKIDKKYIKNLDYNGIELLVSIKQYNAIDKQNNVSINVFGYQDKQPYPVYLSKTRFDNCMNLLLISSEKDVF